MSAKRKATTIQEKGTYVLYRPYEGDDGRKFDLVAPCFDEDGKQQHGWQSLANGLYSIFYSDDQVIKVDVRKFHEIKAPICTRKTR